MLVLTACAAGGMGGEPGTEVDESATSFVRRINAELEREVRAAQWVRATYLTQDAALLAARATERQLAFQSRAVKRARAFADRPIEPDAARSIRLLTLGAANPAPDDPDRRAELARIATEMPGVYGAGRYCPDGDGSCLQLQELEKRLATERDYDALLDVWAGRTSLDTLLRIRV